MFGERSVTLAIKEATRLHAGQKRLSGEAAITHPLAVERIIYQEMKIRQPAIRCAAVLHDTVEDTTKNLIEIKAEFGGIVSKIVDGVTKLKSDHETTKKLARLTPEVVIVKLADKLHNMRTLHHMSREKQIEKAIEVMKFYSPLAEYLGMFEVKRELEDLAFKYLDRNDYEVTVAEINADKRMDPVFIAQKTEEISSVLLQGKIKCEVRNRVGGTWEIKKKQRKMALAGTGNMENFANIKDVMSFRVVVKSEKQMKAALSLILENIPNTDSNVQIITGKNKTITGYEAIHVLVNYKEGPVEVAIMTKRMEETNDWGKAALLRHGVSDCGDVPLVRAFDKNGKLHILRKGATALDLAADISDRLLANAGKAIVNGRISSLTAILRDGDDVTIVENKIADSLPVGINCLPQTRKRIEGIRILTDRDKLISRGRDLMRDIMIPRGLVDISDLGKLPKFLNEFALTSYDDLYIRLGNGSIDQKRVEARLDFLKINKEKLKLTTLEFSGIDGKHLLYKILAIVGDSCKELKKVVGETEKNTFYIRIVAKNISEAELKIIKEKFSNDIKLRNFLVV